MRPLGLAAYALLKGLERQGDFVFSVNDKIRHQIAAIFDAAGLHDARSHDLRRTVASIAADLEYSEPTIGALLGHAARGVTLKHYVRRPDAALVAAATAVAKVIERALNGEEAEVIPMNERSAKR
jgi:integrase